MIHAAKVNATQEYRSRRMKAYTRIYRAVNSFPILFMFGRWMMIVKMSIVRSSSAPSVETITQELIDTTLDAPNAVVAEKPEPVAPGCGTLSLNIDGAFTKDELAEGVVYHLSEFELGSTPNTRVIVDQISSNAIGSSVPASVMVSCNLFNGSGALTHYLESGVKNKSGWTTSANQAALVPQGYAPIVALLPNEYTRTSATHYQPGSGVDDGLMERYGHLSTGENLRTNIISFPGENYYYVAKDHVVLDIIERNWQALGQDIPNERVREGNWIKVSDRLVDKVLDELNSKVLQHMPLTNLGSMNFLVKADADKIGHLKEDQEYPLTMNLSLSYRSIAPELSA